MDTKNNTSLEDMLSDIIEQDMENEEEIKMALMALDPYEQEQDIDLEEVARIFNKYSSRKESAMEEATVIGTPSAKTIKVANFDLCKEKFGSFRENKRIKQAKKSLSAIESLFPLQTDKGVGSIIHTGQRHFINLQKALSKEFKSNTKLYDEYIEKYEQWDMILRIYNSIYAGQFERAEEKIEKVTDENIKQDLITYLEKEKQNMKEKEASTKEEEIDSKTYQYADTVEKAKSQYQSLNRRKKLTRGGIEYMAAEAIRWLDAAIIKGEPKEVIEYRSHRAREWVYRFLNNANKTDYENYSREYDRVMERMTTEYGKKRQEKPEREVPQIEQKEDQKEETIDYEKVAKDINDIIKKNAHLTVETISSFENCTKDIENLKKHVEENYHGKKPSEAVEKALLSLENLFDVNNFQQALCSKIKTFANERAILNKEFWDIEKKDFEDLIQKIDAYLLQEMVDNYLKPLIEECKNKIRITEDKFLTFRENGGVVPSEMSEEAKGKEIRKSFDKMKQKMVSYAKNGQISLAKQIWNQLEYLYKKVEKDPNIIRQGETLESLLYPYTKESFTALEDASISIQNNIKEIELCLSSLKIAQNTALLHKTEDAIHALEAKIEKCKNERYKALFNIDFMEEQQILTTFKQTYEALALQKENKGKIGISTSRHKYYETKRKKVEEEIPKIESKLKSLLASPTSDRKQITELQKELRDNYDQLYLIKYQTAKAETRADQKLYQDMQLALQNADLASLNDQIDELFTKCMEAEEQIKQTKQELQKDNETFTELNIGTKVEVRPSTLKSDKSVLDVLTVRLEALEATKKDYIAKSSELAISNESKQKDDITATEKELDTLLANNQDTQVVQKQLEENYKKLYTAKSDSIQNAMRQDEIVYQNINEALKKGSIDDVNDKVDILLERRTKVQEDIIKMQKEIEKINEKCKQYGINDIKTDIVDLLEARLEKIKQNTESYAVASNELFAKIGSNQKEQEKEREEKAKFYEQLGAQIENGNIEAQIALAGELEPVVIDKMPESSLTREEEVQKDAFRQRISQIEDLLVNGSMMETQELETRLVTERQLVEQNRALFTEEQYTYLNEQLEKGEELLAQCQIIVSGNQK